jgi:hypothetical protein
MPEITPLDLFGAAISKTIRTYCIYEVLEIGAFYGDGSTAVLASSLALKLPKKVSLTSLEYNDERFVELKKNTKQYSFVDCLKKCSIGRQSFTAWDFETDVWQSEFNGLDYPKDQVRNWHCEDTRQLANTPAGYLDGTLPVGPWDAVLIDGGEFVGYDEFRLVKDRTKCLLLDDAYSAFKNNRARSELSKDKDWRLVWCSDSVRNGAAIFVRDDLAKEPLFRRWQYQLAACLKSV